MSSVKRAFLWLLIAVESAAGAVSVFGQCPGGVCPSGNCPGGSCDIGVSVGGWRQPAPQIDVRVDPRRNQPTPAWRYERPEKHRAAVVRIYCQDGGRARSIGSGALVRWGSKVVVITARHVVKDAKQIIVELCTKRTFYARVLRTDATWDCAVLELIGQPEGVEAATVELGPSAMPEDGDRLESCGYGPDGRLACNTGVFIGYRRSASMPNGPDDWMVLSGHAREGDSGGPVFNVRGRLVGILWGTDGKEVICVQPGRVHVLLDDALMEYQQQAFVQCAPTPPRTGPLVDVPQGNVQQPAPSQCDQPAANRTAVLPWREGAQERDRAQAEQIDKLIELDRLRAERENRPPQPIPLPPAPPQDIKSSANDLSPLLAGLCILAAVIAGLVIYFAAASKD